MKIPRIIHQIWSGVDEPLPKYFAALGETWKRDYPDWEYIQWDNKMMIDFIAECYPQYVEKYNSFPYNIQRWDAIRYLILDKIGGMYVDFDYESIEPMDELIADKTCCFAVEPDLHRKTYSMKMDTIFNNAMMLCVPGYPFMRCIVDAVFEKDDVLANIPAEKFRHVLMTTGPWRLMELYSCLTSEEKETIYLIPARYVTPFTQEQSHKMIRGGAEEELDSCLTEAYAVHYFFSDWAKTFD
jgi:hypothetical protein